MALGLYEIEIVQGSSLDLGLTFTREDEPPPLVGATLRLFVETFDGTAVLTLDSLGVGGANGIEILDANEGTVEITRAPAETLALTLGEYRYALWIEYATGRRVRGLWGDLTVSSSPGAAG